MAWLSLMHPGLSSITLVWPGADGVLAPTEVATGTATYTLTQADIDNGSITNDATATGEFNGAPVSADDAVTVTFAQNAALSFDKTVALPAGSTGLLGDVLTYTFTVENTGNVTLDNVDITDELSGIPNLAFVWPGIDGILPP